MHETDSSGAIIAEGQNVFQEEITEMATITRDEMRAKTIKLIHDFIPELQNAELDESSTINTDTNIDSLSLIMLITKVESTFDVRIPRKEWNKINTLGELLDKVEQYRK